METAEDTVSVIDPSSLVRCCDVRIGLDSVMTMGWLSLRGSSVEANVRSQPVRGRCLSFGR